MKTFITYEQLKEWDACAEGFRACKKSHGGEGFYLNDFLKSNNLDDLVWLIMKLYVNDIEFDLSEEIQIVAVKAYPCILRYLINPSESVKRIAIEGSPYNISCIKNPSEELQRIAIEGDPYTIKWIENPSEELQLMAIEGNPYNIEYINNPTEAVVKAASVGIK